MPEQKAPVMVKTKHKFITYLKQEAHSTRTEHPQAHGNEITHEAPPLIEWFSSIDPTMKDHLRFRFITEFSVRVRFIR